MNSLADHYCGKTVLITGQTGFKGSWLALWLYSLGAKVCGYALAPPTKPSNFQLIKAAGIMSRQIEADIRDYRRLKKFVAAVRPDFTFHLAAQSLVRESYISPRETFETNLGGTVNLLEAVRELNRPCIIVVVTSDKCYDNTGQRKGYRETDPMGGHDPYSASKGTAELVTAAYRNSFFPPAKISSHGVKLASARSGNVIGGGDWSPDRIMTDSITALVGHRPIPVRNPLAIRPWQHVLEPLSGYLLLASKMAGANGGKYCEAWNFGSSDESVHSVKDLVNEVIRHWGSGSWRHSGRKNAPPEAFYLTLCSDKACRRLGWKNTWNFTKAVAETVKWYRAWHEQKTSLRNLCLTQIEDYSREM
jgi:CDP-glucose 4,6-dehydratase